MHLDPTKCLFCGTFTKQPPFPLGNNFTTYPAIDADRNIIGTQYWLCSDQCYDRALAPHIDPNFGIFKSAKDHPLFKRLDSIPNEFDKDDEPSSHWLAELEHIGATTEFHSEWRKIHKQKLDSAHQALLSDIKYREEQKRIADEQKATVVAQRNAERELTNQQRQQDREEQRRQRLAEREEETRRRQAERQRLIDEKQAQEDAKRQAEDEKWRPRPFSL